MLSTLLYNSAMNPPQLITDPEELAKLAAILAKEPQVAVDTESNSLHAFQEQVCLIQFSIPGSDFLVDPLALNDLSPLAHIFATSEIEVIFHAAEYDLLTLKRDFGFKFEFLFDTMQAARILGRPRVGLGSLLEEEFDVVVEKKYQRADWAARPLKKALIDYARLDTHYLIELREKLLAELHEKKRWPIAQEDFARLAKVNGSPPGAPELNIWRIKGVDDLSPEQAAILLRIAGHRHQQAERRNRPLFKVIGDRTLLAIAMLEPQNMRELRTVSGMNDGQIRRHGKAILTGVQKGRQDAPQYRPRRPRAPEVYVTRLDALSNWRKKKGRAIGVESDIILPKDIMQALAREHADSLDSVAEIMIDLPWRLEHYGEEILSELHQAN